MFQSFGPIVRQYLVVTTLNLSVLATGLGLVWPSPVLVKLRDVNETVLSRPLTEEEGSWVVSIPFLTGLVANLLAALLVDRIGRKKSLVLACTPRFAAGLILIFTTEVWMLMVGRSIVGFCDGLIFSVVPMYASEIASKEIRGSLGTILQILCSVGVVTMLCIGPFTPYVALNIFYTAAIVITTIPIFFLPDSPYFLYSKDRKSEAFKILTYLRGSETIANEELDEYSLNPSDVTISKRQLFKNRTFLKTFVIVNILGLGGQLCGFNSISFYLQTILESTETNIRPEISSVILGLIQILASVLTTCVTDRFGRKPIMATTLTGLAVGMVGLGTFFYMKGSQPIRGFMNFLPLASLILVVYSYSAGIGSLNWVISAELFDDPSRGVGLPLTYIISLLSVFLTTKYFPLLISTIGPASTYWLFGIVTVLLCLFYLFCVPETKGKSIAEIQIALGAKEKKVLSGVQMDFSTTKSA